MTELGFGLPKSYEGDLSTFLQPVQIVEVLDILTYRIGEIVPLPVGMFVQEIQSGHPGGEQHCSPEVSLKTRVSILDNVKWVKRGILTYEELKTHYARPADQLSRALGKVREVTRLTLHQKNQSYDSRFLCP